LKRLLLLLSFSLVFGQTIERTSNIKFSHDLHVRDQAIKCTKCHSPKRLRTSISSGDNILPTEARCMKCHKVWKERNECSRCHEEEPPYSTFAPRHRIYNFPHKTHVADEELECQTCHGNMVKTKNFPPIPDMKGCIQCHDNNAPLFCDGCHTNVATIRPSTHSITWIKDHDIAASINSAECQTCHIQINCDNCHSGANLSLDKDLVTMNPVPSYRPDLFIGKQLINRNHSLDFVFTHGMDVTFKEKDCRTCHESSDFCSDCHQNNADILVNKPDFHGGTDWGAVRYENGTDFSTVDGGKKHARMARRDIELCYSCHDLEGGDPICVDCHRDNDGIQNTDPKTHAVGFMHNQRGDWCDSEVSLCFTCHENTGTKGDGFCGYCHG